MDGGSGETTPNENELQEGILSALNTHGALSTAEIASIVETDSEVVREQLAMMAHIGQIERRETTNQDVWLAWKNS